MSLTLHGSFTSPYVRHCRIALLQSGRPFAFEPTDYASSSQLSPAKRVPFLRAGELLLTDSSVILQYTRELTGGRFLADIEQAQRYQLANCVLDSAVNLFLLERDGRTPENTPYLQRQRARVEAGIEALAKEDFTRGNLDAELLDDSVLRLGCTIGWGIYRKRFSIDGHASLDALMTRLSANEHFAATAPPPQ